MRQARCGALTSAPAVPFSSAIVLLFGLLYTQPTLAVSSSTFVCNDNFDCEPHGFCGTDQRCACHPGFTGDQCTIPCPLECQNGGQCVMENDHGGLVEASRFYCDCPPSHTGGLCQDPKIPFVCNDEFDCQPHGVCDTTTAQQENLKCICDPGFWGPQCEEPCPLECQNRGQCLIVNEHGGLAEASEFYCDCPSEYSGGLCQTRRNNVAGSSTPSSLSTDTKVGIAVGALLAVWVLLVFSVKAYRMRRPEKEEVEIDGHHPKEDQSVDGLFVDGTEKPHFNDNTFVKPEGSIA